MPNEKGKKLWMVNVEVMGQAKTVFRWGTTPNAAARSAKEEVVDMYGENIRPKVRTNTIREANDAEYRRTKRSAF